MTGLEGIGEAVTGGLAARAVEPGAGDAGDGHTREAACLNCGCRLTGGFCHCCGQKAHVHRTLGAWWHDFQHSVLHLDGKFWRTMPMLVWRPGELTRRYAHGERAKFISPLALFLFTVFLMFAVFSVAGPSLADGVGMSQAIEKGIEEERASLRQLETRRANVEQQDASQAQRLDSRIVSTRAEIERLERLKAQGIANVSFGDDSEVVEGDALFQAAYRKARENPQLLVYKLQANAYKFSWALIPISVPFVWILFLHRRRYRQEFTAYDHLVFVTYSIAFMSLALIVFVLLRTMGLTGGLLGAAFTFLPLVHMYRQLRGAYLLPRFSAAWRAVVLALFASFALSLFVGLLLIVGVLG